MKLKIFFISFLLLLGCQQRPTRVFESKTIEAEAAKASQLIKSVKLTESSVFLDVRPAYEYGLQRLPKSVRLNPEDFFEKSGKLKKDLSKGERFLAALGLSPDVPVVVIGLGSRDNFYEFKWAWLLSYLGFTDVQAVSIEYFKKVWILEGESQGYPSRDAWTAKLNSGILVPPLELVTRVKAQPLIKNSVLIDVRSKDEYFAKGSNGISYKTPELGAIHIPISEFVDEMGFANPEIKTKLNSIGIVDFTEILLVSDQGKRSSAAFFALGLLGFKIVKNCVEGYQNLPPPVKESKPKEI